VIFASGGNVSALAAKTATSTIPIVFMGGGDPLKLGLVTALNRPGGNVTAVSNFSNVLVAKRLELLHQLVPTTVIAFLVNPDNFNAAPDTRDVEHAAHALGLRTLVLNARSEGDFDQTFATLALQRARALVVAADSFFIDQRDQLATMAARHAVLTIYNQREFVEAGGLMSYGTNLPDAYRQAGIYTGRILKGEKPSELPVPRPTKFEFVINLKTANALGLTIPQTLLAIADEVIE
jgi:putative tryptophan/tyrosine transport system substrate-binding protein